jgi:hypothetical protein
MENMTVIQAQGKSFIIRGGEMIDGTRWQGVSRARAIVCYIGRYSTEQEIESIYSVINLEHVHGVTMILIHSYCKYKDIAMHPSSDVCLFYLLSMLKRIWIKLKLCSGRVSIICSTGCTHSATLVTNLMIGHERGKKDGIETKKFRIYPWSCDIFVAFIHVVNVSFSKKWFH